MSGPSREAIRAEALRIGFAACGFATLEPSRRADALDRWLAAGHAGLMRYLHRQKKKRKAPATITPGARSAVVLLENYTAPRAERPQPGDAYKIASYARGMDYHLATHGRLHRLSEWMKAEGADLAHTWVDDGPVPERELAERAGLGWIGKNTMLINSKAGSWFFLAELFTDLPLPVDSAGEDHCGSCRACLDACPTNAFVGPNILDARRCISYLTIELRTAIPEELRPLMGNRVFGCDDCQLVCPWNKFTRLTSEDDFTPRHGLDQASLLQLFQWDEETFLRLTEGSAIRRIGYECWLRNLAVALGNGPGTPEVITALKARRSDASALVREHVEWALQQHAARPAGPTSAG